MSHKHEISIKVEQATVRPNVRPQLSAGRKVVRFYQSGESDRITGKQM